MKDKESIKLVLSGFPVNKADQLKAHISQYVPQPDFIQTTCAKCGMRVWIGPRQNMMQIATNAEVWCVLCVVEQKKADAEFSVHSLGGESAKIVLDDGREIKASFEL